MINLQRHGLVLLFVKRCTSFTSYSQYVCTYAISEFLDSYFKNLLHNVFGTQVIKVLRLCAHLLTDGWLKIDVAENIIIY